MKIAILSTYPFKTGRTDKEHIYKDISDSIKDDFEIEFFSLSDADSNTNFIGYPQHEIKGLAPRNNYDPKTAMLDYISLMALNRKYTPIAIRDNKALFKALKKYKPDYIMTPDPAFYEFIGRFIKGRHAKFIFMTDAWSRKRFELVWKDELEGKRLGFLYQLTKERYVNYTMRAFERMLEMSSGIVLSSEYHKRQLQRQFPKYSRKVYWAPHHIIRKSPRHSIKRSIKNILYIGANDPNAMQMIKEFADKLPSKRVTIAGHNIPKHVSGNVNYFGPFKESQKSMLYGQADICIAPIPASSGGFRAKTFDYFLYGKAVIGTPFAFEGYDRVVDRKNAMIEPDLNRFTDAVMWLERHPKTFTEMQRNAPYVLKDFTKEAAKGLWCGLLMQLANR